jgi:hypothetical protein
MREKNVRDGIDASSERKEMEQTREAARFLVVNYSLCFKI